DRDPDGDAQPREPRERVPDERLDAGPLQSERVDHPVLGRGVADGWVARARLRRDRLRDDDVERSRDVGCGKRIETTGGIEDVAVHGATPPPRAPSPPRRELYLRDR